MFHKATLMVKQFLYKHKSYKNVIYFSNHRLYGDGLAQGNSCY